MLRRQFVKPSFKCIRIMADCMCCIPVSLNLDTGRLNYRGNFKTKVFHNPLFCLGILKTFHIIYALICSLLVLDSDSYGTTILTFSRLAHLVAMSTYWTWELFHRGVEFAVWFSQKCQHCGAPVCWRFTQENQNFHQSFHQNVHLAKILHGIATLIEPAAFCR